MRKPVVRVLTCRDLWALGIPGFRDHDADNQTWQDEDVCECFEFEGPQVQRCRRLVRLAIGDIALNLCETCWDLHHPGTAAQLLLEVQARRDELETTS